MHREPSLTFLGALQILGGHDRSRLEKLNAMLGAGTVPAAAQGTLTWSGLAEPPRAAAAVWAWVDPKRETLRVLRGLVNTAARKVGDAQGFERQQLIAAAHTALVVGTFAEALQERVAGIPFAKADVAEKALNELTERQPALTRLYLAEVPLPGVGRGFEQNVPDVRGWLSELAARTDRFLSGLDRWDAFSRVTMAGLAEAAVVRYRSHYARLAASVPEFMVWAELDDARAEVREVQAALARVEALLRRSPAETLPDLRAAVHRANRGALAEPIVRRGTDGLGNDAVVFPAVEEIYVNPRYRIARHDSSARPGDESWWGEHAVRDDLDSLLSAHLTSVEASHVPMLLLGHPGAGKSLLTRVLAARLPARDYTAVRVPLRHVGANRPVHEQIQQALHQATDGRVEWGPLLTQSQPTLRVILLDGLDELLQAADGYLGNYLELVADFQRRALDQREPVAVLVTSRTVVADQVDVPHGTVMVKLEDFAPTQIEAWLDVWRSTNEAGIAAGTVGVLEPRRAVDHLEFAKQPLLLMLLALYSSDPAAPPLQAGLASVELYRRLLRPFARREVGKAPEPKDEAETVRQMEQHLRQLGVAALGMFNRGRQYITMQELDDDLRHLRVHEGNGGEQVVGSFYFIHVAEAQLTGAGGAGRCYEFMHATFGEYLVADMLVGALRDLAHEAYGRPRATGELRDDRLHALLSHRPLASSRPTLTFAVDLIEELAEEERRHVVTALDRLIGGFHQRDQETRYAAYRPLGIDHLRQLAAYSANLVALRVSIARGQAVPLSTLWPDGDLLKRWRSTVSLWSSGLDTEGWHAMLALLSRGGVVGVRLTAAHDALPVDVQHARLACEIDRDAILRAGIAALHGDWLAAPGDLWDDVMAYWAIAELVNDDDRLPAELPRPSDPSDRLGAPTAAMLWRVLRLRGSRMQGREIRDLVGHLLDSRPAVMIDPYALAAAVAAHSLLLEQIPLLRDPATYDRAASAPLILRHAEGYERDKRLQALHHAIIRHRQPSGVVATQREQPDEAMAHDAVEQWLRRAGSTVGTVW
ncbi:hypothetical protein [Dactylosporangium salmoneum]|uniref:NACHT N-terminal Helical domain-containing protein n=1 Tax=Dactylosporangium salmoneum TaxID=53361 RepID=A0ABP5SIG9_9ACTN